MKHLLLILPLAACAPHVYVKENHHVQMDRSDRAFFVVHDPASGNTGSGDNGAGSASSDVNHDSDSDDSYDSSDSNGDGSDE